MTDDSIDTLRAFHERMGTMPSRRAVLIAEARAKGHTWPEIAAALNMTVHGAIKAARHA